jgi:uncharacterized membrane protein YgcG
MPEAYEIHDGKFIQDVTRLSAANALSNYVGPVPAGKVWTLLAASYNPDVPETRVVHWQLLSRGTIAYALSTPVSIALSGTLHYPLLYAADEMKLFPGEYLYIQRDVATAGSTMLIKARLIETDLPYFSYEEPQKKVVRQVYRHASGSGGALSSGGGGRPEGGGGGGPKPI